jgi:hypothetical protein
MTRATPTTRATARVMARAGSDDSGAHPAAGNSGATPAPVGP